MKVLGLSSLTGSARDWFFDALSFVCLVVICVALYIAGGVS